MKRNKRILLRTRKHYFNYSICNGMLIYLKRVYRLRIYRFNALVNYHFKTK